MRTDLIRRSTACLAVLAACALVPAAAQAAPAPSPAESTSPTPLVTPPERSPAPSVTAISTSPSPCTTPTPSSSTPRPAGACQVTYRTVSAWPGGFVGELTVSTPNPITAWSVAWSTNGGSVQTVWGGELASPSPSITVIRNASWNGTLPAGGTATVGMYGTGSSPSAALFSCTA